MAATLHRDNWEQYAATCKAEIERLKAESEAHFRSAGIMAERILAQDDEIERLLAVPRDLLATDYAEECEECGIGHTQAWKRAKAIIGNEQQRNMKKPKPKVTREMLAAGYDYLYRIKSTIDKNDKTWVCFSKARLTALYLAMKRAEQRI